MQQYRKDLGKVSLTSEGAWDGKKSYNVLSIVYDEHTEHGFISKKDVPVGVDLYNKEYWMPLNVSGYADNNIIILSKKTSDTSIKTYTLEEAIESVASVGRRPGAILGFYNDNNDRLDIGGRWELWQFNDVNVYNWENIASWQNIYYNYNKFVGWYISEEALKKYNPFPEIGCYAYVGLELNESIIYRCDNKYVWNNTAQHAWDYIKVIIDGTVTVGHNGNWFNNGVDTKIPASVKGENGRTPLFRENNNIIEYSYNNVTWTPISDKIASWIRWQATVGDSQANNVGKLQISRDNVIWEDLSGNFINNLHITRYIGVDEDLPLTGVSEGTIYAKGPTYAENDTKHNNPIYRLWVYAWHGDSLAWQDNGEFTSINAGIVQKLGDSETEVISQKVNTEYINGLSSQLTQIIEIDETHTSLLGTSYPININLNAGDVVEFSIKDIDTDSAGGGNYAFHFDLSHVRYGEGTSRWTVEQPMKYTRLYFTVKDGTYFKCKIIIRSGNVLRNTLYIDNLIKNEDYNFIKDSILYRTGKINTNLSSQTFNGAEYSNKILTIPGGVSGANTTFENTFSIINNYRTTIVSVFKSNVNFDIIKSNFAFNFLEAGYVMTNYPTYLDLGNNIFVVWATTNPDRKPTSIDLFLQKTGDVNEFDIQLECINNFAWCDEFEYTYDSEKNRILEIIDKELQYDKTIEVNLKDYANIRECLNSIHPSKMIHYTINIEEGEYDIRQLFSSDEQNSSSFIGLIIPNYVKLKGIGRKEKTILKYELSNSEDKKSAISTINLNNYAEIENLTIKAKRIRYSVHDDYNVKDVESIRNCKNVDFIAEDTYYSSCYGSGLVGLGNWKFESCKFIYKSSNLSIHSRTFSNHNNVDVNTHSYIEFDNCRFESNTNTHSVDFGSLNNGTTANTLVIFKGCKINSGGYVRLIEEAASSYGAGIKYNVTGYFNNFNNDNVVIQNSDGVDYSDNIDLF